MINWLELIFVMSVVSSIMFGAVLLIERFYKTEYIEYVYFMISGSNYLSNPHVYIDNEDCHGRHGVYYQ